MLNLAERGFIDENQAGDIIISASSVGIHLKEKLSESDLPAIRKFILETFKKLFAAKVR